MHRQQPRLERHIEPYAEAIGIAPEWNGQGADRHGFTPLEWLAIAIGQQDGLEARGGIFRLGTLLRGLFGGPRSRRMAVDRLEVLSRVAARVQIGGRVADADVALLRQAGYSNGQLLLLLASLDQARQPAHQDLL